MVLWQSVNLGLAYACGQTVKALSGHFSFRGGQAARLSHERGCLSYSQLRRTTTHRRFNWGISVQGSAGDERYFQIISTVRQQSLLFLSFTKSTFFVFVHLFSQRQIRLIEAGYHINLNHQLHTIHVVS